MNRKGVQPRHEDIIPRSIILKDGTKLIYECNYENYIKIIILLKHKGEI